MVSEKAWKPLLLLSRTKLSGTDADVARTLCPSVPCWDDLISIAERKYSLPMLYRNLINERIFSFGEDYEANLKRSAVSSLFGSLKATAALGKFHTDCIKPNEVAHSYLKGPALAARYYDEPGMRYCRDIDVLVKRESLEAVVRNALAKGYLVKTGSSKLSANPSEQELKTLLRFDPTITLVGSDGVPIEVHTDIDKHMGIFDPDLLMQNSTEVMVAGNPIMVPSTAHLFCYICYHNLKHTWSKLHWLADLCAIIEHSSFDLGEVTAYANTVGIAPLVSATREFEALTRQQHIHGINRMELDLANKILHLCIVNLGGDIHEEITLRKRNNLLGLPFYRVLTPKARFAAVFRRCLFGMKPSFYQYEILPLPISLQWLYYPTKPLYKLYKSFIKP